MIFLKKINKSSKLDLFLSRLKKNRLRIIKQDNKVIQNSLKSYNLRVAKNKLYFLNYKNKKFFFNRFRSIKKTPFSFRSSLNTSRKDFNKKLSYKKYKLRFVKRFRFMRKWAPLWYLRAIRKNFVYRNTAKIRENSALARFSFNKVSIRNHFLKKFWKKPSWKFSNLRRFNFDRVYASQIKGFKKQLLKSRKNKGIRKKNNFQFQKKRKKRPICLRIIKQNKYKKALYESGNVKLALSEFYKKIRKPYLIGKLIFTFKLNNMFISLISLKTNKLLATVSGGMAGFKGPKRSTPYAKQKLSKLIGQHAVDMNYKIVDIFFKRRPTKRLYHIMKGLSDSSVAVRMMYAYKGIGHGFLRSRKHRRL